MASACDSRPCSLPFDPPRFSRHQNQKHDDEADQELEARLADLDEELDKYDPARQKKTGPEVR